MHLSGTTHDRNVESNRDGHARHHGGFVRPRRRQAGRVRGLTRNPVSTDNGLPVEGKAERKPSLYGK
jgi:hypothetical protein